MVEQEILDNLNYANQGHSSFVSLGHVYNYLIDCRLNVFRGDKGRWAIAVERLGYNPRGGFITLEIYYYGNCLPEPTGDGEVNSYTVFPLDDDQFLLATDGETLKPDATHWTIRGQVVQLSHNLQDYVDAGIKMCLFNANEIAVIEAARLMIINHRDLLRATDAELHQGLPVGLKKMLVLDEWFHKDYQINYVPQISDEQLVKSFGPNIEKAGLDFDAFKRMVRAQEITSDSYNLDQWENNRPDSYETWPLLAKVIATGHPDQYKPTLAPNTHWSNWPESGSL